MLGVILLVAAIVIALPIGLLITGGIVAAILGWFQQKDAEQRHAGSELVDLNR
jgi:hypothetical protein